MRVDPSPSEAFILVGGAGRRLGGRDKGLIQVNGVPLVRVIAERLAEVSQHITLLGPPKRSEGYERRRQLHLEAVHQGPALKANVSWRPDLACSSGAGALRAMESAFQYAEASWLWIVAVDLPLLEVEALHELKGRLERTELAHMYELDGRLHPLLSIWSQNASVFLRPLWERGEPLQRLRGAAWLRVSQPSQPEWAINLNRPEDVELLKGLRPSWSVT